MSTEVKNETLIAENVKVDMETLRLATSNHANIYVVYRARCRIVEAVIKGLLPEDRERFEAYERGE